MRYGRSERRERRLPLVLFTLVLGVLFSFVLHWIILISSDAVTPFLIQAQNFFYSTIQVPNGTNPSADAEGDILQFTEFDGTVGISGSDSSVTGGDVITWFVRKNTLYYHTILDEGSGLPQTGELNFTGAGITCADGGTSTDCDIPGAVADGTGYDTIQDEGSPLTQRSTVNFTGSGVECIDNSGDVRTDCTIPGGGGGSGDTFSTIDAPFGTDPVASGESTLFLTSSDSTILITGSATEDSLDFAVDQSLLEFYSAIQVSGSTVDKRRVLNLLGDVSCADNVIASSTDCTVGTTGEGVEVPIVLRVLKTQDEVVNNSSILQDDNELTVEIGGDGQVWAYWHVIFAEATSVADFKFTVSCPPGSALRGRTDIIGIVDDCGDTTTIGMPGLGSPIFVVNYGVLDTTSTGSLTVQWSQGTAESSDTTVLRGSYLKVVRLDATQIVGGSGSGPHSVSHAESGSDPLFSQHGLGLVQTGTLSTTGDIVNVHVPMFNTFTIKDIRCRVSQAPTGADLIVDAFKNGSTIFTTTANRPTIANGELEGVSGTPDITTITIGDFFNIEIVQVGSSLPGQDLTCVTRMRQALYDSD